MFRLKNKDKKTEVKTHSISKDGITFIVDEKSKRTQESIDQIAKIYPTKERSIAEFMIEKGIFNHYDEMPIEELVKKLGSPTIEVDTQRISYEENSLDKEHIISLEYSGLLEKFFYFTIDG